MVFPGTRPDDNSRTVSAPVITWLILAFSLLGYIFIGYALSRPDFLLFISVYLLLFAGYIHLLKRTAFLGPERSDFQNLEGLSAESATIFLRRTSDLKILIAAGILFRLAFLFSIPALSDDYFRFVWDGAMWTSGNNPYTIIPSFQLLFSDEHNAYLMKLYAGMNSPDYFTVYPPVCQFIFGLASELFPGNLSGAVITIRIFCIAADIGTIYLLQKILFQLNLPKRNVLLYALNPLVIIELSGNIHPEAVMIFFLLMAVYLLLKFFPTVIPDPGHYRAERSGIHPLLQASPQEESGTFVKKRNMKFILSAISFALAIASKLIPLIFLPLLIKRLKWRPSIQYFLVIGGAVVMLFLPFINKELITQMGTSINLYFQKFEFNAGIYYLIRWLGYEANGFDIIQKAGPSLAVLAFLLIVFLAAAEKDRSWRKFFLSMQWTLTIYFLLATTVHPWYITTLVMIAVVTGYQYPIVWSLFIALSYSTYQSAPYQENLWFVAFEYLMVLSVMFFEVYTNFRKKLV